MGVEIHDGTLVRITRSFDHPPERLFVAFTQPDCAARRMWADLGSQSKAQP